MATGKPTEMSGAPDFHSRVEASGLVSHEQLLEVEAALEADSQRPPSDQRLADKLVERGYINPWQADQLCQGHVRFNLGPYRIVDSIGQGGMGQVFKAEHAIMKRVVAVKVLPRQKSTPEAAARFQREIQAQAQLDHPNLVRALDAGHDGNVDYLVTEYVSGTDLRRLVRRQGKLSMSQAAPIIWQAAHGLAHAHRKGLIHRDIKPGNLLVTPEGLTKISDLGLVGFFSDEQRTDLDGQKIVGTADYLSPEQITHPKSLSPASDIYSLGCTLYYAVTGKVPYPGGSVRDKARAHLKSQPLDPRRLNAQLDYEFVDLVADMMAKDVGQRIATAEEVIARIAPWVRSEVPAALGAAPHESSPVIVFDVTAGGTVAPHNSNSTAPRESRPRRKGDPSNQALRGTSPVDSASEETVPMFEVGEFARRGWRWFGLSPRGRRWWLMIAIGGALLLLLLILLIVWL